MYEDLNQIPTLECGVAKARAVISTLEALAEQMLALEWPDPGLPDSYEEWFLRSRMDQSFESAVRVRAREIAKYCDLHAANMRRRIKRMTTPPGPVQAEVSSDES